MSDEEIKKELELLNHSRGGQALKIYLGKKLSDLDSVSKITDNANFEVVARGQRKAVEVLKELFNFLEGKKPETNSRRDYT